MFIFNLLCKYLTTFGSYLLLMGRSIAVPDRMRMFFKRYLKEMSQLGVDSIGIVLLISFFIGAVICIQMKVNIQSPWMPRWVSGYTTREIMLLEFSSSIMCRKGGFEHCFRARDHARDAADRCAGHHGREFCELSHTS